MVEFKSFTSGRLYEPLVIGLFLYDADANKKITETFYFDCKKMDVNQLGFNVNKRSTKMPIQNKYQG